MQYVQQGNRRTVPCGCNDSELVLVACRVVRLGVLAPNNPVFTLPDSSLPGDFLLVFWTQEDSVSVVSSEKVCGSVAVGSYSDVRLGKTSHPMKIAGKGTCTYVCVRMYCNSCINASLALTLPVLKIGDTFCKILSDNKKNH